MRPLMVRPLFVRATAVGIAGLCLVAGVLAAGVLGAGRIAPRTDWVAAAERNWGDITGSIGPAGTVGTGSLAGSARSLPLTDEQRGHIFDGIMKLHNAPVAKLPAPAAATAVPGSVPLQELPASVTREIPIVQGYKFVKLDDRILLVSPVDRSVVAEMPRYRIMLD